MEMMVYNAIMVAKKTNTGCSKKLRFLLSTTSPLWLSGPHDWLLEMCICGLLPLANHFMTTNHSSAAGKGSIQKFFWKRRTFSGIPWTQFFQLIETDANPDQHSLKSSCLCLRKEKWWITFSRLETKGNFGKKKLRFSATAAVMLIL